MKALIQRVSEASVSVGGQRRAQIANGVLALIAATSKDGDEQAEGMARRLADWHIFEDERGRIGKSLRDKSEMELLLVPQFTLAASGDKGTRPDFSDALPAAVAERLLAMLAAALERELGRAVQYGVFGAKMQVRLCNEGPVTFLLEETAL